MRYFDWMDVPVSVDEAKLGSPGAVLAFDVPEGRPISMGPLGMEASEISEEVFQAMKAGSNSARMNDAN
ncbi:MAG: hypothetical protein KAX46_01490 [Chromatiaceae bacterium]|nr:hypothetical protein [Chromatiaceae bacterium]